jgi:hypothetical protein
LRSPARDAKVLAAVTGEVEVHSSGRDPASTVTIPDFLAWDGVALSPPSFSSVGVEVVLLGRRGLAAERKAAGEAARRSAASRGLGGREATVEAFEAEEGVLRQNNPLIYTALKAKDPLERIVEIVYVDPRGSEVAVPVFRDGEYRLLQDYGRKPGRGWALRIRLRTPETFLLVPFALKDVPLP